MILPQALEYARAGSCVNGSFAFISNINVQIQQHLSRGFEMMHDQSPDRCFYAVVRYPHSRSMPSLHSAAQKA